MRKWGISLLGLFLLIYGLVVVSYSHQSVEIGVRCAFDNTIQAVDERSFPPGLSGQDRPKKDDLLIEIAGHPVRNWAEYLRQLNALRATKGPIVTGPTTDKELAEKAKLGIHVVTQELGEQGRETLVHVRYQNQAKEIKDLWCIVGRPPTSEFLPSLSWFLIKLGLLLVGATVFWKRSDDPVAVQFFLLCIFTVGAFMGGYHWLRISTEPALVIIFMISAVLLPPVSLHFYLIFPHAKGFLERYRGWVLSALYAPSLLMLLVMLMTMLGAITIHRLDRDPELVKDLQGRLLLTEIYIAVGLAAMQFLGCIISLSHSYWSSTKGSRERQQVKWILAGASIAAIPIIYTLRLAATDPEAFGMGGATWPMFLASLSITLAYGVGISRYGFLDVGELLNRSILPLAVSLAVGLAYALIVFIGMLILGESGSGGMFSAPLQQATWVSVSALVMLTVLDLARSRIRVVLDRRLDKTKVLLDQTLKRMSMTVEQQIDAPTLGKRLLYAVAELIDLEEGSIYLRKAPEGAFRLTAHLGKNPSSQELATSSPMVEALQQLPMVRLRYTSLMVQEPAQRQLRDLGGELALPLRYENTLLAILIIGHREAGTIDVPSLHLLTTFAQIAGLALHGAEGHAAMESLNKDLQDKVQKISEQQRRIVTLQSQLLQLGAAKAAQQDNLVVPALSAPKDPITAPFVEGIVGGSAAMRHLLASVKKVAQSQSAVLIRGESGTGKELVAKALHDGSPRAKGPFVKVHCAALAPGLLESELFGHVKGAFTGAIKDKAGRFELADKGTLFLDEIGDISLDVQTKLLRVLQEMAFERVGSTVSLNVDVRIIAATNQDLEKLMKEGKFREDLFFRLNVITIRTPPLRERPEDILELADHFLRTYSTKSSKPVLSLDDEAAVALKSHPWPGNVREMENVIERAVVLADGPLVTLAELPEEITAARLGSIPFPTLGPNAKEWNTPGTDWSARYEQEEHQRLVLAMSNAFGNKSKAARALGMPRSTFVSKLEKHGLLPKRV